MSLAQFTTTVITKGGSARSIGVVRIIIGLASLLASVEILLIFTALSMPEKIHIPYLWRMPGPTSFQLSYIIPASLFIVILFTIGWRTRFAGTLLVIGLCYALLYDQQIYSNHLYLLLLMVLLLTLADSGARLSIDAIFRGGKSTVKAWPLLLMKIQICIVYCFAALSKMNMHFLSGAVLSEALNLEFISNPLIATWISVLMPSLAYLSIGVELFIPIALWFTRARWYALWVGIGFHVMIILLMGWSNPLLALQLTIFALTILAPYTFFFVNTQQTVPQSS